MVELVRMITAALAHPTYGVNAQIKALTPDDGDNLPPTIVKILDVTRPDSDIILDQSRILDWPVLVVSLQNPIEGDREFGEVMRDYTTTEVFIDLVVGGRDAGLSTADVLYTIRCIIRTLRDLLAEANAADVVRGGICLLFLNRLTWGPVAAELPSGMIVGTVVPDFAVRDTQP